MTNLRLCYQTIEFGEIDIHICTLRNIQEFYDPDGIAEELGICSAAWPIFGIIWPSSLVLAHHMINYDIGSKKVLEIGCGTALSSLLLNKHSIKHSVIFQVRLSGQSDPASHHTTLTLKDFPLAGEGALSLKNLALMPSREVELRTFTGSAAEGRQGRLHQLTLARMDAGDASLVAEGEEGFTVEGRMVNVSWKPGVTFTRKLT